LYFPLVAVAVIGGALEQESAIVVTSEDIFLDADAISRLRIQQG
jgi:hypothetical protein